MLKKEFGLDQNLVSNLYDAIPQIQIICWPKRRPVATHLLKNRFPHNHHTEKLGPVSVTTPARSPQSNGMSEAFVGTMRRDYIEGAELWSPDLVIAQLSEWEDYSTNAPHSALGMKSPRDYRLEQWLPASSSGVSLIGEERNSLQHGAAPPKLP